MPKNTIDETLHRFIMDNFRLVEFWDKETEQELGQALYQDLLELVDEYDMNDVMMIEHRTGKPFRAIPVEALNQYFRKGE